MSTFRDQFTRTQLKNAPRLVWLVEIAWAGRWIRLSEEAICIESDDGPLRFAGALRRLELTEEARFFQTELPDQSVSLDAVLPADVVEQGRHTLAGKPCEISQIIVGDSYERRVLRLRGRVQTPAVGPSGQSTSLTIVANIWEDTSLIPAETQQVDGTTWATVASLAEQELGLAYPIVYGQPGYIPHTGERVAGSQGVWVDHNYQPSGSGFLELRLVLAGHRVTAHHVYLCSNAQNGTAYRFEIQHDVDLRGQTVAYVDAQNSDGSYRIGSDFDGQPTYGLGFAADIPTPPNAGEYAAWYAAWLDDEDTSRGGMAQGQETLRHAGEVLPHLMSQSTLPIDWGRWRAIAACLAWCQIDTVIDARCSPWQVAKERILPLVPLALVLGPQGIRPVLWRGDALPGICIAVVDVHASNWVRASKLTTEDRDIKNRFILHYAHSLRTDTYKYTAYAKGGTFDPSRPETAFHRSCFVSQHRYKNADGSKRVETEETSSTALYDRTSASKVLSWRALALALARRQVEYELSRGWAWVELGMAILLTDSDIGLAKEVAVVDRVSRRSGGALHIRLTIWEIPNRDHGRRR